ncbi:MAG: 5'-nucleotidase C-terminal domain-containing protein [Gemmatimonadaceae bacterium]
MRHAATFGCMLRFAAAFPFVFLSACGYRPSQMPSPTAAFDLIVAATTDVHGHLLGWDYYTGVPDATRGLARAVTIVDSLRAAAPGRVVLVDAGDLLQGNPLAYVSARIAPSRPHPVIAAMNSAGYDAAAIGNHEFNFGLATFNDAISDARFPFLAANAYLPRGELAYSAWRMVKRGPLNIAIVGATTPGAMIWDRDSLRGRLEVRAIVPDVRIAVREARSAGADAVVVVVHSGLTGESSYDTVTSGLGGENVAARIAHDVPGVDLIVYGHSHREMPDTIIGSALLIQPRNWATSVAIAHLGLVLEGSRWRVKTRRGQVVQAAGHSESQRILDVTRSAHEATVSHVTTVIGKTPVAWRSDSSRVMDTPLTDFILEVQRRAAGADLASTAVFSLDAGLGPGPVTVADVARLYPYENTLKAVRVNGRQLREYLEFSARYFGTTGTSEPAMDPRIPGYNYDILAGADYTIDVSKPPGARISSLSFNGRRIADEDSFSLALNSYRQSGGGGYVMLRGAPVMYEGQTEIRQLLIDEVKRRGTLRPEDYFKRNWSLVGGRAARSRRLRIIATNDFHGALEARPDAGGIMRGGARALAAAIERARRECEPACATIILDGGDMFQGTAASNLAFGRPVVELYNLFGVASAALGNHEFDWGIDTLRARMRDARYAILGANVRYADGSDVQWIPNDTIVERSGLRIGIVGAALVETPQNTKPSNVAGLTFDDPAPIIDSTVRALRNRGTDAIVVVAHIGAFCSTEGAQDCRGAIVDLASRLREPVDAIVSGHTHSVVDATVNGTPIVQARSSGRAVGIVDLVISDPQQAEGAPERSSEANVEVRDVVQDSTSTHIAVDSVVERAVRAVAPLMSRRIASIAAPMLREGEQYALGNLIADAQRAAGRADIAAMNNGGIRANLSGGRATYGSLYEIQPFGNILIRYTVRGRDLRAYFERLVERDVPRTHVSGLTVVYDSTSPAGERVLSIRLSNGREISPAATYTFVMSDFIASVGEGLALARAAVKSEPLGIVDLDALIAYLKSRSQPVSAPRETRFIARP